MAGIIRNSCIDCKYRKGIECTKGMDCPMESNEKYMKEQKSMIVIRFGKWSHKATSMFTYTRIFRNGYKWTPLCIKKFRYVGVQRQKGR